MKDTTRDTLMSSARRQVHAGAPVPWYTHGARLQRLVQQFVELLRPGSETCVDFHDDVIALRAAAKVTYTTDAAVTRRAIWSCIEARAKTADQLRLADLILEIVSVD